MPYPKGHERGHKRSETGAPKPRGSQRSRAVPAEQLTKKVRLLGRSYGSEHAGEPITRGGGGREAVSVYVSGARGMG